MCLTTPSAADRVPVPRSSFRPPGASLASSVPSGRDSREWSRLSYHDRVVSFEFVALDYTDPQSNQYAYKLEGFDEDWVYAGNRLSVTYTNLDGGSYTFRVKVANSDGVWNEDGISLALHVATPPWQTWWAYSLYMLVLMLLVVGYIRFRTQSQERELARQRKELERERLIAEQLRQVDRLKDEFIANTSTHVRNILSKLHLASRTQAALYAIRTGIADASLPE
jgi:DNA-binding CsgD family transcriptional regulator